MSGQFEHMYQTTECMANKQRPRGIYKSSILELHSHLVLTQTAIDFVDFVVNVSEIRIADNRNRQLGV